MVEPPGTAPGSAAPIVRRNLSPYPVETGTGQYRAHSANEKGGSCAPAPNFQTDAGFQPFFSASRISVSRSTSLGPAGAAAGGGIILLAWRTIRKMTKAMITKLMIAVMNEP